MQPRTKRFRESAISILLLALVAAGWLVALNAHDEQRQGEQQYQEQSANNPGGEDAWLSSLNR